MLTKEIEGYTVDAIKHEYHVEFTIYHDLCNVHNDPDGGIAFFGSVKWDGCSNWHMPGDNYQVHYCGLQDLNRYSRLIKELYQWAAELLPETGTLLREDVLENS